MLWFDNLDRQLIFTDFFATYEKPHFLQLDPKQPNKFVAAIPKIKFRFWRFPYWGGVVLVHDDGAIEDLSREEALADKRLKGQWIAPIGLTRYYVELQNYNVGWGLLSPYVNVTGKMEIPKLPGVNGGAKLVHPGGAKLVHLTLCGTRCWGVVPVVHRRDPRCFV